MRGERGPSDGGVQSTEKCPFISSDDLKTITEAERRSEQSKEDHWINYLTV